jgi:chromosome segregation ATPase
VEGSNEEQRSRRDVLADLEARIDAAIEEVRPKVRRAMEELDARVDAAVSELRPRVESAMEDVKPRVDRFIADLQPRLDSALERIQAKIAELRQDLEERAEHRGPSEPAGALPPVGDATAPDPTAEPGQPREGEQGPPPA